MELPLDIIRVIRSWLPFHIAHRWREINKNLSKFNWLEFEALYQRKDIQELLILGDLLGVGYLLNPTEKAKAIFVGEFPSRKFKCGQTLKIEDSLMLLAAKGLPSAFQYILDLRNRSEPYDHIIQDIVVENSNLKLLKYLIGSAVLPLDSNILIMNAMIHNNLDMVKFIYHSSLTFDLNKALSHAIYARNVEIVRFVIEAGADVEYNNGEALASILCYDENTFELMSIVIENGAQPTARALIIAINRNKLDWVRYLIEHGAPSAGSIIYAVMHNRPEIFEYLVTEGADLNENEEYLIFQAANQNPAILRSLVSYGLGLDRKFIYLITEDIATIRYLEEGGARVEVDVIKAVEYSKSYDIKWKR